MNRVNGSHGQLEQPQDEQDDMWLLASAGQTRKPLAVDQVPLRSSGTGSSSSYIVRTRSISFSFLVVIKFIVEMRILRPDSE